MCRTSSGSGAITIFYLGSYFLHTGFLKRRTKFTMHGSVAEAYTALLKFQKMQLILYDLQNLRNIATHAPHAQLIAAATNTRQLQP